MRKLIVLVISIFIFHSSFAQVAKISGSVNDANENKPVKNAVIAILLPKDSILYKFTRTNAAGKFTLKDVAKGKYILMTTHPYFADLLDTIEVKNDEELPSLSLISKSKLLQEIIIKSGAGFRIKGDTTVYTADSFKVSANANVGELLNKLPGIQVDKNGKITAMGQTVEKILVDGEEFFGDDPGMAVKNLRADAVKEVQVFDKKSDQAEFTGIDDGKTQKTINLKLKDDKKHGYFGKIDATEGTKQNNKNRFNDNLMFGSFKGKRKLAAFLIAGNTGQDGLSWQDERKYSSNDDFNASVDDNGNLDFQWLDNSDGEPNVDTQDGFITNVNAGLQYTNKWNDKYNFNLSPKYNGQQYTNHKETITQTQVGDSVLNSNSSEADNINRYNFKIRGILDTKLDSMNSIKITANTNFYHTASETNLDAVNTGNNGTLKNTSNRDLKTSNDKDAVSGNLLFRHRFHKGRRTLTFAGSWNILNIQGTNFLKSFNQAYNNGLPASSQDLNQMKNYNTATTNMSAKIVYTEPLSKKYSLELAYQLAYNYGTNNQLTYNYTPFSNKYDVIVDSLSNQFKQNIVQNIPSARINFANKKIKLNIGSGFGITNFDLKDLSFNKDYVRNYVNFYPAANATYTYKPNHEIEFAYNGNTTQPTINQLQPLTNNNDYFNQIIGNPNLKPSFTNQFRLNTYTYNFLTDFSTNLGINVNVINNGITYNRIINVDSGKTVSQSINMNGNMSMNFYSGFGFKIKKIDTRIYISPQFNYSKYADIINSVKSISKTNAPGISLWVSKQKEKKYELSVSYQFNYNANSTSQNKTKIHYNTNEIDLSARIYVKKVWSLLTDFEYYSRQKTPQISTNLNSNQWGARIQRTFHNDEFTAYISVHDILNDNLGVNRNFNGNTYTQVTYDQLKRYFLIGFEWDFKNKASKAK
jgi:hypothetical protein